MAGRLFLGRGVACRPCGNPSAALLAMAVSMATPIVTIATGVGVAMGVACEMNVRPIGVAWNIGMGGMSVRHRGSAEEHLGNHTEHEHQSHGPLSLRCPWP